MIDLNDEQRIAGLHKEGPMLVLAGAGSGKTRIVTFRVLNLINSGVEPSEILALTFTNKAAGEMKERLFQLCPKPVLVTTFHSLGARMLREYAAGFEGLKEDFTIYDENDSEKLIKSCLDTLGIKDKKLTTKAVRGQISTAKNALVDPEDFKIEEPIDNQVKQLYALYSKRLREYNAVDFDDLLFLTAKLLEKKPETLKVAQERWKYFLIDEYQDTNHAQYVIAKRLSSKSNNLFVVGDPDQSIYSWRGANIKNILNFEKDFPGAKVVKLEQNYRSTEHILQAANALIQENESRYEKDLWSALGAGEKVSVCALDSEYNEAEFVIGSIEHHLRAGTTHNEIAVLYRTNAQSRSIEDGCLDAGIPYVVIGGISFYQRKEVKDALALLRLAVSPGDYMSFNRVIKALRLSVGDTSLAKIQKALGEVNELDSIQKSPRDLFSLCAAIIEDPAKFSMRIGQKQRDDLTRLIHLFKTLKKSAEEKSTAEVLKEALDMTHYFSMLRLDPETFEDRKENVESLVAKAIDYEMSEDPSVIGFLNDIALKTNLDEGGSLHGRIRLMTMHNAKGLEFDVVFLVGMEEDLFPHINSKGDYSRLEEERRLCYVGMTRAKQKLYLTCAQKRSVWGSFRVMYPSRFLSELPKDSIEKKGSYGSEISFDPYGPNVVKRPSSNQQTEAFSNSRLSPIRKVASGNNPEPAGGVFESGEKIFHPEFGQGKIDKVYEGSFGWMYEVTFQNGDSKTLVAKFAPLSRV